MGFFRSIFRLIQTMFGLAEGKAERATDKLLVYNSENIHDQFRKTREDWIHDFNEMKEAIAELCNIREQKQTDIDELKKHLKNTEYQMQDLIGRYKKTQNEDLRLKYAELGKDNEHTKNRISELEVEVKGQDDLLVSYKNKLQQMKVNIDNLKAEEAQTVADIITSRKINELNDKLNGFTTSLENKNLQAIRDARKLSNAQLKLDRELNFELNAQKVEPLVISDSESKFLLEFDQQVSMDKLLPLSTNMVKPEPLKTEINNDIKKNDVFLNKLFK